MASANLIHNVWIAQLFMLGALAVVLVTRRAWKDFPLFTAYALFGFLSGLTKYFVYKHPNLYFFVFWISDSIAMILGLAVVYEVFRHLFSIHHALRKLASISFAATIVVLLALGGLVFYGHSPSLQNVGSAVLVAEEAARILEVGLLMFLFLFAGAFGLHWRQPVFGISLGLGIFTAVELISVVVRSRFGIGGGELFSIIRMLAFNTSLLVWAGYLLAPERATSAGEVPDRTQLEQWNQAIMELIHQ